MLFNVRDIWKLYDWERVSGEENVKGLRRGSHRGWGLGAQGWWNLKGTPFTKAEGGWCRQVSGNKEVERFFPDDCYFPWRRSKGDSLMGIFGEAWEKCVALELPLGRKEGAHVFFPSNTCSLFLSCDQWLVPVIQDRYLEIILPIPSDQ